MADAFTANYSFTLVEVGASTDTWGAKLNANFSSLDSVIDAISDLVNNITDGFDDGTVLLPGIFWESDTNTGFWRIGADNFAAVVGGVSKVNFSTTGLGVNRAANAPLDGLETTVLSGVAASADDMAVLAIPTGGTTPPNVELRIGVKRTATGSGVAATDWQTIGVKIFPGTNTGTGLGTLTPWSYILFNQTTTGGKGIGFYDGADTFFFGFDQADTTNGVKFAQHLTFAVAGKTIRDLNGEDMIKRPVSASKTASFTAASDKHDIFYPCNATSGAQIATLPAAATCGTGYKLTFKKTDATANTITVDPNGAETVDGASTYILAAVGDVVTIISDGVNWAVLHSNISTSYGRVDMQVFTASGTWTKPSWALATSLVDCIMWGGGGSGGAAAVNANIAGGGGGGYKRETLLAGDLGATETITIGAGGAARAASTNNGLSGGDTTIGSKLTAYGGGGGNGGTGTGGGGGGWRSAAVLDVEGAGSITNDVMFGGRGGTINAGAAGYYGGGAGAGGNAASQNGGGNTFGGGGGASRGGTGGVSTFGGNGGGPVGTAGSQPGGGGASGNSGASSGAGGNGKVVMITRGP